MTNPIAVPGPQRGWRSLYIRHLVQIPARVRTKTYPYWDGARVLFSLESKDQPIPCAISRAALDQLAGERQVGGPAFIRSFLAMQGRIKAIARDKLDDMPGALTGTLNIWISDLDDLPPSGGSSECRNPVHRLSA